MNISISPERADGVDAMQLIAELDALLTSHYAIESCHGYSVEKLIQQGVAFFVVRVDGVPAGCGGIQLFGKEYGELKRIYVRPEFRERGLAKRLIERLSAYALAHGVTLLRLETGVYQTASIALYEKLGFKRISPFGDYTDDPVSLCYEKSLVTE